MVRGTAIYQRDIKGVSQLTCVLACGLNDI